MSNSDQNSIQSAIVETIAGAHTDVEWDAADVSAVLVGTVNWYRWGLSDTEGAVISLEDPPPVELIIDGVTELQKVMSEPKAGTWLSASIRVNRRGTFSFSFNYDDQVYVGGHEGAPMHPNPHLPEDAVRPTAEDYRDFLDDFPRAEERISPWMPVSEAGESAPASDENAAEVEKKLAAPIAVPAAFDSAVAGDDIWCRIFDSVQSQVRAQAGSAALTGGLPLSDSTRLAGDLDILVGPITTAVCAETLDASSREDHRRLLEAMGRHGIPDVDVVDVAERLISTMVSRVLMSIFGVEPVS